MSCRNSKVFNKNRFVNEKKQVIVFDLLSENKYYKTPKK